MMVDLAALIDKAADPAVPLSAIASKAVEAAPDALSVAKFGFAGTVVLALVTLLVAVMTNRTEKKKVADATVEAVLRERLLMKDEKIKDQDEEIEDLKSEIRQLEEVHARCQLAVDETRAEERAHLNERRASADS
jgi:uncharacterized protein YlxW (UPF0749 family)